MARRRIREADGETALAQMLAGDAPRQVQATAVRYLLEELAERAPGHAVEVRVPPFGATQCIDGPRHSRGTPPNVIEMDAETWVGLATGGLEWQQAHDQQRITASGTRAHLDGLLPLRRVPRA